MDDFENLVNFESYRKEHKKLDPMLQADPWCAEVQEILNNFNKAEDQQILSKFNDEISSVLPDNYWCELYS